MISPHRSVEGATPTAAILLVFGTGILFACLDASAKYLVLSGIPAQFVAWVRFAEHVVLALMLLRGWANPAVFRYRSLPRQLMRGVFLFGSTFFNFQALQTLQLAEAMSIMFFSPMVVTALAGPMLGEWAGWRRWLAVVVGLIGVLVITRPGFAAFGPGHGFALCAMASYSVYVLMTRKMAATETAESLVFYSALAPVVLMSPVVPYTATLPTDTFHWLILLSLGFYGGIGHWMLIKAYKLASTTALAPYPYLQMVWMILFGYLFFGQLPDRWTLVGAAIIVASGLYIVHREHRLRLASSSSPNSEDQALAKKL